MSENSLGLDVRGSSAVHGAGPGQVSAGGAAFLSHCVLHLWEQGALELLLEVIAHENIQHWVEDAVRCSHADGQLESGGQNVAVVVFVVELEEDEDVVGQPAEEKSSDERGHDSEGLGGFDHPVGSQFENDDRVADDDDDKGDNEPSEEAAHGHNLVTVLV